MANLANCFVRCKLLPALSLALLVPVSLLHAQTTAWPDPASDTSNSESTVTVGQTVTVNQSGSNCSISISTSSTSFYSSASSGQIYVTADSSCAWTAQSSAGWVHISSGSSGMGNGVINFSVDANSTGSTRSASLSVASVQFTITQLANAAPPVAGLRFVPVTPCRVLDTRNANGPFGGPLLSGQTSRSFAIPNSNCGIPASAQAYSINVAVVPNGGLGYLTVWPTGGVQPYVSVLNSLDGRVKSSAAIVPAGTGGAISVYATNDTHLVIDINGYFVAATNSSALAFYPLTPCRVMDTRSNHAAFAAGETRSVAIQSSSCGIPGSAQAYSVNFAAIPNGPLAYLSTWPKGSQQPLVSTLNDETGTVTANAAIVAAGTGGDIEVFATHPTDLVIDINGYFAPPGAGGLSFYPIAPCRVSDTRYASGAFLGLQTQNIGASTCGLPAGAPAYVFNTTVVPSTGLGYLTLWPDGNSQPLASTLNALDGAVTSNMAIVPANGGVVDAFAPNQTQLIIDATGYFAP